MKIALAVFALVVAFVVVVQGEAARSQPVPNAAHAQRLQKPEPQSSLNVVNTVEQHAPAQQQDGAERKTKSYLTRLFAPENLPNILLFLVGLTGIGIAICTLRVIRKQVEIEKDAFIATHRPRLLVKHVALIPGQDITRDPNGDLDWRIGCVVANVGGSKAHIEDSDLTIRSFGVGTLENLLPAMPPYAKKYVFGSFFLQPGERQEKIITLDPNAEAMNLRLVHATAERRRQQGGERVLTHPIVCFGFFRYRDESGVDRMTGFGWLWNAEDMSFTRLDHPNYEYAD